MDDCKTKKDDIKEAVSEEQLENVSGGLNPFERVERIETCTYDDKVKDNV